MLAANASLGDRRTEMLDRPPGGPAGRSLDAGDPPPGVQRREALRGLSGEPRDLPLAPLRAARTAGRGRRAAAGALQGLGAHAGPLPAHADGPRPLSGPDGAAAMGRSLSRRR